MIHDLSLTPLVKYCGLSKPIAHSNLTICAFDLYDFVSFAAWTIISQLLRRVRVVHGSRRRVQPACTARPVRRTLPALALRQGRAGLRATRLRGLSGQRQSIPHGAAMPRALQGHRRREYAAFRCIEYALFRCILDGDMKDMGLRPGMAMDPEKWRCGIMGRTSDPHKRGNNGR